MFGTVLYDSFKSTEFEEVRAAIEDLCSPLNAHSWASVGIYVFYEPGGQPSNPIGTSIQYIGLARDLSERFAQHAGLIPCPAGGCKRKQIEDWFKDHDKLGFACFVQSPFAQVDTHRERAKWRRLASYDEEYPGFISNLPDGLENAVALEGQLIETFRLLHRVRPPWNKVGGSAAGRGRAAGGSADGLLLLMDGTVDSLFRARRTLRGLSSDPTAAVFEFRTLHLARMATIMSAFHNRATDRDVFNTLVALAVDPQYRDTLVAVDVAEMRNVRYLRNAPGVPTDWM